MKKIIIISTWNTKNINFALLRARNPDIRLICIADENSLTDSDAVTLASFDKVYLINGANKHFDYKSDFESLVETVKKELGHNHNTYVLSFSDLELYIVAKVRAFLQLAGGHAPILAEKFLNKFLMKQDLLKNNIRVPYCFDFSSITKERTLFDDLVNKVNLPFIIKPQSGCFALGVKKIENYDQYADWFENHFDKTIEYVFEEFIDGTLFHADFTLKDGKIIFSECCEYSYPVMENINGKINSTFPLESNSPLKKSITNFAKSALDAMGAVKGSYHMEIFKLKRDGSLCFLEVGARPAGAYASKNYELMHGINIFNLDIEVNAGLNTNYPAHKNKAYLLWGYIRKKSGIVKKLNKPKLSIDYEINWLVKVGDILAVGESDLDYAGVLQGIGTDYQSLHADFIKLKTLSFLECEDKNND